MYILIVKFHSELADSEVGQLLRQRLPSVSAVAGLLQKYYTREASTGDYVGIHVFDSMESLERYRNCEISRSLPIAYKVAEPPRVEAFEVLFKLRSELETANAAIGS